MWLLNVPQILYANLKILALRRIIMMLTVIINSTHQVLSNGFIIIKYRI